MDVSFVLKLFLAFGLAFEIPIATMLLIKAGIASPESLKEKRPYIFIGCFVVGMLLTPPDVISQTLLAFPMWLLFEIGLIGARFLGGKAAEESDEIQSSDSSSQEAPVVENEAIDGKGEIDESDLYSRINSDSNDSPVIEELDDPTPLDDESDEGPKKPHTDK